MQAVQTRSPAPENESAGQAPHAPLLVGVQGVPAPGEEPAAHDVQLAHGAKPDALYERPATHRAPHAFAALFHA